MIPVAAAVEEEEEEEEDKEVILFPLCHTCRLRDMSLTILTASATFPTLPHPPAALAAPRAPPRRSVPVGRYCSARLPIPPRPSTRALAPPTTSHGGDTDAASPSLPLATRPRHLSPAVAQGRRLRKVRQERTHVSASIPPSLCLLRRLRRDCLGRLLRLLIAGCRPYRPPLAESLVLAGGVLTQESNARPPDFHTRRRNTNSLHPPLAASGAPEEEEEEVVVVAVVVSRRRDRRATPPGHKGGRRMIPSQPDPRPARTTTMFTVDPYYSSADIVAGAYRVTGGEGEGRPGVIGSGLLVQLSVS
ncbi:hypothetical protein O3P69_004286 [Scylla paramamosain]|uniref:Uncharacterized protein n=1 Tax=Scylla paramamosain TaxID=85552 RepID=A0AAW0UG58_SCYPA